MLVRPYRPTDRGAIRRLVLHLHEELRPYDQDLPRGEDIIDRYLDDLLEKTEKTHGAIFLAEVDGRIVGHVCVYGRLSPNEADERPDPYSFMAELYVEPDVRRGGIGKELVEQAEACARRCGAYKMELNVLARNEEAVRFYEDLGYEPRILVMTRRL